MTYQEVLKAARGNMGTLCKVCDVCNGMACGNHIPGPGAKGSGDGAVRNYKKWQDYRVNMDTLTEVKTVSTRTTLFGKEFQLPVFAGPVGSVAMHYGDKYDDNQYNNILVSGCKKAGIAAFTGDGPNEQVFQATTMAIKNAGGLGVPTVKPWNMDVVTEKMRLVKESDAFAVAMDVDAAGLPFLRKMVPPAGGKSVEELKQIVAMTDRPFIVKGIMTVAGAKKAVEAGAAGIVVSNHGGRVQDQCPATVEVLEAIVEAVKGKTTILIDGGIRSGVDVFKALALGADGVIIARPFVNAVYGAEEEGIQAYVNKIKGELEDTMTMCGAATLQDITRDMVTKY